jgi:hypothetical protein
VRKNICFLCAAFFALFVASCDVPSGMELKTQNWLLDVPIGSLNFLDGGGDGLSFSRLSAENIQEAIGADNVKIYGSYINTGEKLFAEVDGTIIDGEEQQTYLIQYSVPLGEPEIKDKIKDNFNTALDDAINSIDVAYGIYIEQPPAGTEISFPVSFDPSMPGQIFNVLEIKDIVFDVKIKFPNGLPIDTATEKIINDSNKNKFLNWVSFGSGAAGNAASVDLSEKQNNIVIWHSKKITKTNLLSEFELIELKFDLTPGIIYKPEIEINTFESIKICYNGAVNNAAFGDTGLFLAFTKMFGGAEFENAYMMVFSEVAVSGGLFLRAVNRENAADIEQIISGTISEKKFKYRDFYSNNTPQLITASTTPVNLTGKLLKKNAPVFDFQYRIEPGTEFVISSGTGIDIVLVIPLKFTVMQGVDNPVVEGKDNKQYIKLNIEQLDNMQGIENDFDIKEKIETQNIGKIKKAALNFVVHNKILSEKLNIGLKQSGTVYDIINLKDGAGDSFSFDVNLPVSVPQTALLVESETGTYGDFYIKPVLSGAVESEISLNISAGLLLDINYKMDF